MTGTLASATAGIPSPELRGKERNLRTFTVQLAVPVPAVGVRSGRGALGVRIR